MTEAPQEHPGKFWIKFLLSRRTHTHAAIVDMMTMLGLGGVEEQYVARLESEMDFPDRFQPSSLSHRQSNIFLRREGIYEAWHRNRYFTAAHKIVIEGGRPRELLETFILSPLKPHQVAKKFTQKTKIKLHEKSVKLFQHYWWNKQAMTGCGWGDFIRTRDNEQQELLEIASQAEGADGARMVLFKTGALTRMRLESSKIFTDFRDVAYMAAMQIALNQPSPDHADMLKKYAQTAKIGQDVIDASSNAMTDIVESYQAFRLRTQETPKRSIAQLTGGNYTEAEDIAGEKEKLGDY